MLFAAPGVGLSGHRLGIGGIVSASTLRGSWWLSAWVRVDPSVAAWLLDDLIRPRHQFVWNCNANLLRSLEANNEFKPHGLFDREIGRLGAFQDFVHENSRTSIEVIGVDPVVHETALVDILLCG